MQGLNVGTVFKTLANGGNKQHFGKKNVALDIDYQLKKYSINFNQRKFLNR